MRRILATLNNFHTNLEFTYEEENNFMLSFLDVLIVRRHDKFDTAVFRKETNTDIYLHWDSFAPLSWKKGTLTVLVARAFLISSTDYFLEMELEHLKKVFSEINGFPNWLVQKVIKSERDKFNSNEHPNENSQSESSTDEKILQIIVPYRGRRGELTMKRLSNTIKRTLPNTTTRVTYKGTRLSSKFNLKDREKLENVHDVVYQAKCPDCSETYIGETARRLEERVEEHAKKDKNSHLLRHARLKGHRPVSMDDFSILSKNFKNYYSRKISEAIAIKKNKPSLNKQDMSVPIVLFN